MTTSAAMNNRWFSLLLFAALGLSLSSCSGSVLFDEDCGNCSKGAPVLEPVTPTSGPAPVSPSDSTKPPLGRLELSTTLRVDIWNDLFPELNAQDQDLQLLPRSLPIQLQTRSVKIDHEKFENHLEAKLQSTLVFDETSYSLLGFLTQAPLVAVNEGPQDVLRGTLIAPKNSRLKLRIEATRQASPTAELAAVNPWKGVLYLSGSGDSKELIVGTFEGRTQFLDAQK
jgi:hypothetical protein